MVIAVANLLYFVLYIAGLTAGAGASMAQGKLVTGLQKLYLKLWQTKCQVTVCYSSPAAYSDLFVSGSMPDQICCAAATYSRSRAAAFYLQLLMI